MKATKGKLKVAPGEMPVSGDVHAALAVRVVEFERQFKDVHLYEFKGPDSVNLGSAVTPTSEFYSEIVEKEYPTPESAMDAWARRVSAMIPSSPSTLYWRIKPEICRWRPCQYTTGGYGIYSRFIISDKPRI